MSDLKPLEIVRELDKYIIGQDRAKRSVAIALRNRWRRRNVEEELREEIKEACSTCDECDPCCTGYLIMKCIDNNRFEQ